MTRMVKIILPAKRGFVGLARLAVGGFARALAFDAGAVEDIKLAVSEESTHFILAAGDARDLNFDFKLVSDESGLTIDINCPKGGLDLEAVAFGTLTAPGDEDLGVSIITSLLDRVELILDGDGPSVLRLKKLTELPI